MSNLTHSFERFFFSEQLSRVKVIWISSRCALHHSTSELHRGFILGVTAVWSAAAYPSQKDKKRPAVSGNILAADIHILLLLPSPLPFPVSTHCPEQVVNHKWQWISFALLELTVSTDKRNRDIHVWVPNALEDSSASDEFTRVEEMIKSLHIDF